MDAGMQVLVSFLTAVGTALITSVFYGHRIRADLKKEYASRVNERRWSLYDQYLDWLIPTKFLLTDALEILAGDRESEPQRKTLLETIAALEEKSQEGLVLSYRVTMLCSSSFARPYQQFRDAVLQIGEVFDKPEHAQDILNRVTEAVSGMLNAMRGELGLDSLPFAVTQTLHKPTTADQKED